MTRLEVRRRALRHDLVRQPTPARRAGLTWPRLPAAAEVAIIGAGYLAYALVRLAVRAGRHAAFVHAAELWRAERWLHLDVEPSLNHLASASPALAEATGYYYGLLHFIVTPLVLGWLYLGRRPAFPRLRSALVLATTAANIVFWTWPAAPPRYSVPGMTDVLVRYHILGAGAPHGPDTLVNLYAAMPSLHVAWAAWCAVAVITATRSRWRHLAWLYPAATTVVVLASANHFVLDAAAGAAIMAAGLLATRRRAPGHAPARPPAGPLPGAARPVPEVSGAALTDEPGGQHPPGTSRVVAAATAASSPPPHPQGDRHDHDQNAPAGEPSGAGHRAGRPADPGAAAGRRLAGRVPDPAGRPHRDRGDRPGRDADRAGDQHPAADHLHRRGLERPDPRPRRGPALVGAGHRARARRCRPANGHLHPPDPPPPRRSAAGRRGRPVVRP